MRKAAGSVREGRLGDVPPIVCATTDQDRTAERLEPVSEAAKEARSIVAYNGVIATLRTGPDKTKSVTLA